MHDLTAIVNGIVRTSFPELMDEDIQVTYAYINDAVMQSGAFKSEGFYIEVDTTVQDAPVEVLEGGLAHELSHLAEDRKESSFRRFRDSIAYRISPRYKRLVERDTDVETIMRGYGRQLIVFLQYCEGKGCPHYREDGLSIREVQQVVNYRGVRSTLNPRRFLRFLC